MMLSSNDVPAVPTHPDAPEIIEKVKSTRYSIARRYGRITAYGHEYIYQKLSDRLIRADIFHQQKTKFGIT